MKSEISIHDVKLSFPVFHHNSKSLRAKIFDLNKPKISKNSYKVFDTLNINIKCGEKIGLIGSNGAGKSTFLKLLAGVYKPDSGAVNVNGNITSIFDLKAGLDLEATGYENIPLLMTANHISLLRKSEILQHVETFTELGDALNRPVRTYSTGMRLRLTFSVATAYISEIILIDEIIGVGDAKFKKKSKEHLEHIMQQSGILVLASHSTKILKSFCSRGLVFEAGEIVFDGDIDDAIKFSES